jgi:hypothetical protein
MHWINIHTETLRGEEFVGAEPLERATWLSLLGWCCAQENSGRIESCSDWTTRKWQQLCGITLEEVQIKSALYTFDGSDLIVHFYPIEQQESVAAKRENGKKGGRPKKIKQAETLTQQGDKPCGYGLVNHEGNHMGNLDITLKERKEKEGKVRTPPSTKPKLDVSELDNIDPKAKQSILEWIEYKDSIKKPMKQPALKKLLKSSPQAIIAAVDASIMNGYQGLFPEKYESKQQHYTAPSRDLTKPTMS